ncbi:MAG: hypothetical protein UV05_C0025G0012 [candidate division CPR1 bacterium GW2011_GWA2_42_17]|uniref:CopG-like ribbon-helix-helix domain-containing protein n=1 Tax=candidate division CPR1 bacterium GW2011_GWA2_42_17 TaxID=1618341 RepID=A0A0G0Z4M6_9BACT|nr:MAG: hypothetical protein UV05_C0025G0012 [candidate division CPR1 bacterium GW2011_GWA2_42_17]
MNGNLVRTTITLPADLYEQLRQQAFYRDSTISQLVREGIRFNLEEKVKKTKVGQGVSALKKLGRFAKGRGDYHFDRAKFYDEALKRKMSFGF